VRFITRETRNRRELWLDKISVDGKVFSDISLAFENELKAETLQHGQDAILDHLRVCGHIPERYPHDSSEEKLYSKYTDSVISHAFASLGMKSRVLTERADAADVEVIAADYTFVADAKAFRLSRTAKNQKDFKVQAMDGWRGKNDFAIVVCPIYQLPKRESQIYQQAITRNVCVFSYSHLSVLVRIAQMYDRMDASNILKRILLGISKLPVSKSAEVYWKFINEQFLTYSKEASKVFQSEILAEVESVNFARTEGLEFYIGEEKRIEHLDFVSVVKELKRHYKFDSKKTTITSIADNGLFSVK
jgi:hypothetical protein